MLKKHLPLFILAFSLLFIFFINYSPSTFLIGWDNRLPELNPILNLQRSIFSVWQEHQGLGLLAGNGHAAEIPHQIITAILSLILPLNLVRQIYVFLMLATGVAGAFFLIKKLIFYNKSYLNFGIPLLGALFYLFNLATVQTFYVPFEPFINHYAFLPWLLLSAVYFVANRTRKAQIFFVIINVLSLSQAQVPTVFFVYFLILVLFLFVLILETKNREIIKRSIKVILMTLFINAFWLLPFIYFVLNNGSVAFGAKINQMSTDTVFLQNKEVGNLTDVMLLKGFWFNNVDPNLQGNFNYMFSPWREHIKNLVEISGYIIFGLILIGFIYVKRKAPFAIPFCVLFLFSVTMLTTNTPPFSLIDSLLRDIPIFKEVFRFPFTKFSTITSLTYSFFFAIGVGKLLQILETKKKLNKPYFYSIIAVSAALLVFFVFPIFKGNLFYSKEKVIIPKEYFQLFEYFETQDPNTRIANFPQLSFWGWNFYNWGYGGSGFLWHGIKQPILDRAFDVWSKNNENYYWEASYALYSKNPILLEKILSKYQVTFLLVDKNVIHPSSPRALFYPETEDIIKKIPSIKKVASFGNLDVYKITNNAKGFVFLTHKTASVNQYRWGNNDKAYSKTPNYISDADETDFFYPFRSLFSGKNEEDKEFALEDSGEYLEFSKTLPNLKDTKINLPSILESEASFVATFNASKNNDGSVIIKVDANTPQIYIDNQKLWGKTVTKPLFLIPQGAPRKFTLSVNGANLNINLDDSKENLGSTYISATEDNFVVLSNGVPFQATISKVDLQPLLDQPTIINLKNVTNKKFMIKIYKVNNVSQSFSVKPSEDLKKKVKNCESFKNGEVSSSITAQNMLELFSKNGIACVSAYSPSLSHEQGYVLSIENENKKGKAMHFWVLNEDEKIPVIDTYLEARKGKSLSSFVIPPQEQFGQGYSIHFDNISIGQDEAINDLGAVSLYPIPYNFIASIFISDLNKTPTQPTYKPASVNHPNETYYDFEYPQSDGNPNMIVLSQSFDYGWRAYQVENNFLSSKFPFIFGKEIKNHILVNGWENGFVLDNPSISYKKIAIIYLPQYLQYLGFIVFLATGYYGIFRKIS